MHNIYIRVQKYPVKQWMKLPFVATDHAIFTVLETWAPEWRTPNLAEFEKVEAQKKKDDAKLCITQLAKKRQNEKVAVEVRAMREVAQKVTE